MTRLQDFGEVSKNLKASKKESIAALHKIVFVNIGDRNNRQRLRNFEGFTFQTDDEEYKLKLDYIKQNCSTPDLIVACHILELSYNTENLPSYLLQNLLKDFLLASALTDDTEGEEDDNEDVDNNGGVYNNETVSNNGRFREPVANIRSSVDNGDDFVSVKTTKECREVCFAMNFRDVEESLNTFHGDSSLPIETWLNEFKETSTIMHWDSLQKFVYAKKLLRGIAALFVKSERGLTSWPKQKTALENEFKTEVNSALLHKQLIDRKMKKDKNIQEYFLHMKGLAARGNIENSAIIQYTIDGIMDTNANKVVLYGAQNLKQFKDKLKAYESLKTTVASKDINNLVIRRQIIPKVATIKNQQ